MAVFSAGRWNDCDIPTNTRAENRRSNRHAKTNKGSRRESHSDKEAATYTIVSTRLYQCSIIYGILSKDHPSDAQASAALTSASDVYSLGASFLYPGGLDNFNKDMSAAQAELLSLKAENDNRRFFIFCVTVRIFQHRQCRPLRKR